MPWQYRDLEFQAALRSVVDRAAGRCALAGAAGVQLHVACRVGADRPGPPAHAVEVVSFDGADVPDRVGGVPVVRADPLGFEASIEARRVTIELAGAWYPVAAPEHLLGMALAAPRLTPDVKWACFVLMRIYEGGLDLEEVRGFLKRCAWADRQSLLAELAYLAA